VNRKRAQVRAWLVLALLAGCQTGAQRSSPTLTGPLPDTERAPVRPAPGRRPSPRPSELPRSIQVAVRIEQAEGRRDLLLQSGARSLSVRRLGAGLEVGGKVQARLEFGPTGEVGEVRWNSKRYRGHFEVLPHPRGGLRLINHVDLESYVAGVVASELPLWSAEPAELRAQAIASRTYALYTLAQRGMFAEGSSASSSPLSDSVADQAYGGRPANAVGAVRDVAVAKRLVDAVADAVASTRGQVLTRRGRLDDVRYHASCGGRTSALDQVFPNVASGSVDVQCPCAEAHAGASQGSWKHTFTAAELGAVARALNVGERVVSLVPVELSAGQPGRWLEVLVQGERGSARVSFLRLRALLGPNLLRSGLIDGTWPHAGDPIAAGAGWAVYGAGHGHGVGLCQTGARLLAERGWSTVRILRHYFSGAVLEALPGSAE